MAKFKIGDRVKCINASGIRDLNLIEGREYIVYGIDICAKCGFESIDVGFNTPNDGNYRLHCTCGHVDTLPPNSVRVIAARRFEKAIEKVEYIAVTTNIEIQEPTLN